MDSVRACAVEDLPGVTDLFHQVFRHSTSPAPESLRKCFQDIYFGHPWDDERCRSLVCATDDGRINGFIGATPLRLRMNGQTLLAAVAGTFMIRPGLENPLTAPRLLRAFLARGQDLSITDTANDIARCMWEDAGAATCLGQSLRWFRVLRPMSLAVAMLPGHGVADAARPILRYPARAADRLARMVRHRPPPLIPRGYQDTDLLLPELLESLAGVSQARSLRPDYDLPALEWVLSRARQKVEYGPLHQRAVRTDSGRLVGWYMYYGRPGEMARVLQVAAVSRSLQPVVDSLLHHAWQLGAAAVEARICPASLSAFSRRGGVLLQRGQYVVVHTDRPPLVHALDRGDAVLSRLEGDWWTPLMGDKFS